MSTRGWIVWVVGVIAYTAAVLQRTSLGVAGIDAADRFHAPAGIVASFVVLQLLVYAGLQVPVGIALDRFGTRRMVTIGAALMAVGQILMATADDVPTGMAARVLVGAGDAMTFGSVIRLVPAWFPPGQVPLFTHLTCLLGGAGGRHPRPVGGGHGHGTHALENCAGHGVVGNSQRHGPVGLPQVPAQGGLRPTDDRERTGPERPRECTGILGDLVRESVDDLGPRDQHGRRHLAGATLGCQQCLDAGCRERIAADAVHGVRGEHETFTVRDDDRGPGHGGFEFLRGPAGLGLTHEQLLC